MAESVTQDGVMNFKLRKVVDPRVDTDELADIDNEYIGYVGAQYWNKHKYVSSTCSPSQIKFTNIKTPGQGYLYDMKWWIEYKCVITFQNFWASTNNQEVFHVPGATTPECISLRPYPLHQCTNNIQLRLNNRDIISYPSENLNARMEFWPQKELNKSCGWCPHMKPGAQSPTDMAFCGRNQMADFGKYTDGDYSNITILDLESTTGHAAVQANNQANVHSQAADVVQTEFELEHADAQQDLINAWTATDHNGIIWGNQMDKTITFKMREPVIATPLDFTSTSEFGRTMWGLNSIEVTYNFDDLRNMILLDKIKILKYNPDILAKVNGQDCCLAKTGNVTVTISDAVLIMDVATPFTFPQQIFTCAYKQFTRYEKPATKEWTFEAIQSTIANDDKVTDQIVSDNYSIQFHPNSIYLWVAPSRSVRYDGTNRYFLADTYARITNVEITYGNTSRLLSQFDCKDLFLMSLRNGLQDRSYKDWCHLQPSFIENTKQAKFVSAADGTVTSNDILNMVYGSHKRWSGVGSMIRLTPGIDIVSGDTRNPIIGGMRCAGETIQFIVKYYPLNYIVPKLKYSLFVLFEFNGICSLAGNTCDVAMVALDSYEQLAAQPRARINRTKYAYGAGLWDKTKSLFKRVNQYAKNSHIISKTLRQINHPIAKAAADIAEHYGYGVLNPNPMISRMQGGRVIPPGSFYRKY